MATLTQAQSEHLRAVLQQRRNALLGEIRELRSRTGDHPYKELADVPDAGDASTADLLIDVDNAMVHRDVQEIRDIEAALRRIGDGDYGVCVDCGQDIDFERLSAFPTARRCVLCQGRHEKTYAGTTTPTL